MGKLNRHRRARLRGEWTIIVFYPRRECEGVIKKPTIILYGYGTRTYGLSGRAWAYISYKGRWLVDDDDDAGAATATTD